MDDFPSVYSKKNRFNLLNNNNLIKNLKIDWNYLDVILKSKKAEKILNKVSNKNWNIIFEYIKDLHTFQKVLDKYWKQKNILFQGDLFWEKSFITDIDFSLKTLKI
jgi:hypothetical protein